MFTRFRTDVMTIAARTDSGRFANSGARTTAVARIRPAVISDDSWVRLPAASPVADWLRLASTANPPNSPAPAFAAPRAMSSWFGSIS